MTQSNNQSNVRFKALLMAKKQPLLCYDINSSDIARMCSNDEIAPYVDETLLVYVGKKIELTDHVNIRLRNIRQ